MKKKLNLENIVIGKYGQVKEQNYTGMPEDLKLANLCVTFSLS